MVSQYVDLGPVSREMAASDRLAELMKLDTCEGGVAAVAVKLSLLFEGLGHG